MATQDSSEEITFGQLIKSLKRFYHSILIGIYTLFRFFIKNWIILLVLIVAGAALGYFLDHNSEAPQKTTLLVRINYNSAHYIYDAVDQLQAKIEEGDTAFLKKIDLYHNHHVLLQNIEINPIVSIPDILMETPINQDILDLLSQHTNYNENLLTSALFISQYRFHKIRLRISGQADKAVINTVLNYLNHNKVLQETKTVYKKNLAYKIKESQFSIAQIDSIIQKLGTQRPVSSGSQVSVQAGQNGLKGLQHILQRKAHLLNKLKAMRVHALHFDAPVVVMNKPVFHKIAFNKTLWFPVFAVALFILFSIIRAVLNKGKQLAEERPH